MSKPQPTKAQLAAEVGALRRSLRRAVTRARRLAQKLSGETAARTRAEAALGEALERQTATSAILRVISRSPTDIRPVLETIVEHAGRVCGAFDAVAWLVEGDHLVRAAHHGPIPLTQGSVVTQPIDRAQPSALAVLECRTVHVEDMLATEEFPRGSEVARRQGFRTVLTAPLVKDGAALGALLIRRTPTRRSSPSRTPAC